MTNDVVIKNNNLPSHYEDNVEQLAAEAANDLGTLLKFGKNDKGLWAWILGDNEAPAGAEFVAGVDGLVIGWVRFEDQKVVERILKKPGDKRRLPNREELSMVDKSVWPLDNKGQAKDPWVKQHYLPMMDTAGALVTFVSGSVGGKIAIGKLCDAYLKNNKTRPIIQLDTGSFRSRDYGVIPSPAFRVIGFEGVEQAAEKGSGETGTGFAAELNDAIPF